jgi:glutathione S-transferase
MHMITVHHLNDSRSQRVLWLLEELELPYEIRAYQRNPTTRLAPPELQAVHRLGKSPVIEADGQTVIESGATAAAACSPTRPAASTTSTSSGCTTPRARPCCR